MNQPFGDEPPVRTMDEGALIVLDRRAHQGAGRAPLRVTKILMSGDTVFHRTLTYEPIALAESRLDTAAAGLAERMHAFLSGRDPGLSLGKLQADVRAATYGPPFEPPLRSMVLGSDHSIWLERFRPTEDGPEWLVLDPSGEPAATVVTPATLRVLAITHDHVWGVESDEMDVDYIVRYRIVR